jgi:hypothetical protein
MAKKKKKIRPAGEIFLDLEILRNELIDDHGFQAGDILAEEYVWLMSHRPDAFEEYSDGSGKPHFYYGPKEGLK